MSEMIRKPRLAIPPAEAAGGAGLGRNAFSQWQVLLKRELLRIAHPRGCEPLLGIIAIHGGWRTIGKKGITVDRHWHIAPELGARVGERVRVRLGPADTGRIYVFNADGYFLCIAEAPEIASRDRVDAALIQVEKDIAQGRVHLDREEPA